LTPSAESAAKKLFSTIILSNFEFIKMSNYDYPDILDIDIEEDEILDHSFDPQQLEKDY